MERGIIFKEIHVRNYIPKLRKKVGLALIALITLLVIFSVYLMFFYSVPCNDKDCFDNAMLKCKKVSLIKEYEEASWLYRIIGGSGEDNCRVEVKLLKLKEGSIDSEKLQGKSMICDVLKTETRPEQDTSKCSGVLKEELQDIIIKRMHEYILENLGEIKEEFKDF